MRSRRAKKNDLITRYVAVFWIIYRMSDVQIRKASAADADPVWHLIGKVVFHGDTNAFVPDTCRGYMPAYWFVRGAHPVVAIAGKRPLTRTFRHATPEQTNIYSIHRSLDDQ